MRGRERERESIAPACSHAHFTRCAPRRRLLQQQTDHRHEIPQSIIERAATISHFGAKPCLCGSPTKRELPPLRLFRSIKIRNRYGEHLLLRVQLLRFCARASEKTCRTEIHKINMYFCPALWKRYNPPEKYQCHQQIRISFLMSGWIAQPPPTDNFYRTKRKKAQFVRVGILCAVGFRGTAGF